MEKALRKLVVDFRAVAGLSRGMDEELADLVVRLCTQAGIAMEDTSVLALTIGSTPVDRVPETIRELEKATKQMMAIVSGALALCP